MRTPEFRKEQISCLTEFFEDHLFGSDAIIDELDTKADLEAELLSETSYEDFDQWFQKLRQKITEENLEPPSH